MYSNNKKRNKNSFWIWILAGKIPAYQVIICYDEWTITYKRLLLAVLCSVCNRSHWILIAEIPFVLLNYLSKYVVPWFLNTEVTYNEVNFLPMNTTFRTRFQQERLMLGKGLFMVIRIFHLMHLPFSFNIDPKVFTIFWIYFLDCFYGWILGCQRSVSTVRGWVCMTYIWGGQPIARELHTLALILKTPTFNTFCCSFISYNNSSYTSVYNQHQQGLTIHNYKKTMESCRQQKQTALIAH